MLLKIEKLSHRSAQKSSFHTFSSIRGDFTRYQLEKNPRGTKEGGRKLRDRDWKRSNWVNCSRRGGFLERERGERERGEGNFEENRGTKREKRRRHRRDIPYFTNEISFHEGSCVTREQSLSSVYIRAYGVSRMRCLARLNFHRKFGNTLIIGSLLSRYLICNAIFVGRREYSG